MVQLRLRICERSKRPLPVYLHAIPAQFCLTQNTVLMRFPVAHPAQACCLPTKNLATISLTWPAYLTYCLSGASGGWLVLVRRASRFCCTTIPLKISTSIVSNKPMSNALARNVGRWTCRFSLSHWCTTTHRVTKQD